MRRARPVLGDQIQLLATAGGADFAAVAKERADGARQLRRAHTWLEPGKVLNGPGVADMKGGIAVMLAALKTIDWHSVRPATLKRMPIPETLVMVTTVAVTVITGNLANYHPLATSLPEVSSQNINVFSKLAVGALSGFEYIAILAGETRAPARNIDGR